MHQENYHHDKALKSASGKQSRARLSGKMAKSPEVSYACHVQCYWSRKGGGGNGPPKLTFMHGSQVRGLTYNECSLINVANALA